MVLGLAWNAEGQQPQPPPWFHQGVHIQTYQGKPLPETIYGQPIDSSQSPEAALHYVEHEVESRTHFTTGGAIALGGNVYQAIAPTINFPPYLQEAMVPIVVRFGAANLMEAYKLGPSSLEDRGSTDFQLIEYEKSILRAALLLVATPDNLSDLIDASQKDPELPSAILQKAEWRNDPRVDNLAMKLLNSSTENYTALAYALASENPALQAKGQEIINAMLEKRANQNSIVGTAQMLDRMMIGHVTSLSPHDEVKALIPRWASAVSGTFHTSPGYQQKLMMQLADEFRKHPEAFANTQVRDGLAPLITAADGTPGCGDTYDFLAAGWGNKGALIELLPNWNTTNQDLKQKQILLNHNPTAPGMEVGALAQDFFKLITYQSSPAKRNLNKFENRPKVISHLDSAVYSNGRWTVIDPDYKPAPPVAATPPPATVSVPPPAPAVVAPSAPVPVWVPAGSQPVAPAATTNEAVAAPPAPVSEVRKTAVVTTATKIEAVTSSGGHAALPLDVGDKLTIISVNNDGTVTAVAKFNFQGTVPPSAIKMEEGKGP